MEEVLKVPESAKCSGHRRSIGVGRKCGAVGVRGPRGGEQPYRQEILEVDG